VTEVVPRWEWRTFDDRIDPFAGAEPERVQESDETYLLSLDSDASVKVRDDLMDVKRLEHVNGDGVEQWRPVLKAAFPLGAADVRVVLEALAFDVELARETYSLDQLLAEIVRPSESLRAVDVHKHRERHSPNGCTAELTEVAVGRHRTRTVAVETTDPSLLAETVQALGLAERPNVCVARGLKTLVGFDALRYAVIDVGTNSVKFHVGERRPNGEWRTVVDRADISRLGEGLADTGRLGDEPIARTVEAIAGMTREARDLGAVAIAAVGTAGMRIAPNAQELVAAVDARCGLEIEVISGEEEARLAFRAATAGRDLSGTLVVFDTGGGSSQFTFGHDGEVDERFSVEVGAVRLTEAHGLGGVVSDDSLAAAIADVSHGLAGLDGRSTPSALVALGGAVTNLAAVKHELATYDPDVVNGTVLDRAEIERQIELYRTRTVEERRQIAGLQPKRADVILAGALVVRTVLEKLGRDELVVSDRGLRHGLIRERFR
jgi:exopolyphosphatase/guanosine-5'-triphosphate,3'-diphosphate pyrophosphatase